MPRWIEDSHRESSALKTARGGSAALNCIHATALGRRSMVRKLLIGSASAAALTLSVAALAQEPEFGSATNAKAMLDRAIPDPYLYVFCFNASDGTINAGPPALMGKACSTLADDGDKFCQRTWDTAKKGTIHEVAYMIPRPGSEAPAKKTSFVTKVAGQVCGLVYSP
jgi:hypothetical protein